MIACESLTRAQIHQRHFRKRLWHRYGIADAEKAARVISRQISAGQARRVHQDPGRSPLFVVTLQGQKVLVAYSVQRRQPITALPKESREYREYVA